MLRMIMTGVVRMIMTSVVRMILGKYRAGSHQRHK